MKIILSIEPVNSEAEELAIKEAYKLQKKSMLNQWILKVTKE